MLWMDLSLGPLDYESFVLTIAPYWTGDIRSVQVQPTHNTQVLTPETPDFVHVRYQLQPVLVTDTSLRWSHCISLMRNIGEALKVLMPYTGLAIVRHTGVSGTHHSHLHDPVQLPSSNSALKSIFLGRFS